MKQIQERKELIKNYLRSHPAASNHELSHVLGIPLTGVWRARQKLKDSGEVENNLPKLGHRRNEDSSIELVTANPCNLDDLLRVCRVDLKTWRVAKYVVNKWEVGAKNERKKIVRTPLFQIKAWLERLPGQEDSQLIKETVEWVRKNSAAPRVIKAPRRKVAAEDSVLLELTIPDLHYGKLAWAAETGSDYDIEIAGNVYIEATKQLLDKTAVFPIDRILLVVGSDFFNVNGAANETAAGTPQSEDTRWPKTFRRGVALIQRQIEMLRGRAIDGVDVVVIRGNHDAERMYMAGEVIKAMYDKCPSVRVTNEPIKRQYYEWGTVLLGMTHGDGLKHDKLPLLMAGEAPAMWARTTHREWHVGHLHHSKETFYHTGTEHNAVRVRILPSLTTADDWHFTNGYVGAQRAAEAYLWGKKAGYIGHLSWTVPSDTSLCGENNLQPLR